MMAWYTFNSENDFNIWHQNIKNQLGYPLPSVDIEGNIIGEPFTTEYTNLIKFSDNDWRASIEEAHAEELILSEQPIFQRNQEDN